MSLLSPLGQYSKKCCLCSSVSTYCDDVVYSGVPRGEPADMSIILLHGLGETARHWTMACGMLANELGDGVRIVLPTALRHSPPFHSCTCVYIGVFVCMCACVMSMCACKCVCVCVCLPVVVISCCCGMRVWDCLCVAICMVC